MHDIEETIKDFRKQALTTSRAHYLASDTANRNYHAMSICVVFLNSFVASAIFGTISNDPAIGWKIAAGAMLILTAVLSGLQTHFKMAELAERHRVAGANYGTLRMRTDLFNLEYAPVDKTNREEAMKELARISQRFAELASESPRLSDKLYEMVKQQIDSHTSNP